MDVYWIDRRLFALRTSVNNVLLHIADPLLNLYVRAFRYYSVYRVVFEPESLKLA